MTEHFFRHGEHLALFFSVDDPIFLEEPMVRTQNWIWNPNGFMAFGNPFEAVDELGDKPPGWVPFWPLGTMHPSSLRHIICPSRRPRARESLYPEYMETIKALAKEEAAEKA